jgi:hypothetical protein
MPFLCPSLFALQKKFGLVNIINQSFFSYLKLLSEIDDKQFTNNGERFNIFSINHLLTIGALDQYTHTYGGYDQNKNIVPSYKIVCINYFGKYIKESFLRQKINNLKIINIKSTNVI